MLSDFLTPRVERLSADGRWTVVHEGGLLGRVRPTVVLLARELTSFSLFEASALPWSRRTSAARLHARTGSPYISSDYRLSQAGRDLGIWWWDAAVVEAKIRERFGAKRPLVRPETLAQHAGNGWRVVRQSEGYEAQLWREGLVASAWRRERFDEAAWSAFVRSRREDTPAPLSPPAALSLPVNYRAPAFAAAMPEFSRERWMAAAGAGAVMLSAAMTLFLLGQGWRVSDEARGVEAQAAEIAAALPGSHSVSRLAQQKQALAAFAEIEARTSPLSATGAAIGISALYDLSPTGVAAEADSLTLTLPYKAAEQVNELVEALETSGYFYDVRPHTDARADRFIIEMKNHAGAPPLSGIG